VYVFAGVTLRPSPGFQPEAEKHSEEVDNFFCAVIPPEMTISLEE
jgi:hypothetical protein